jgi:hypothetical protein
MGKEVYYINENTSTALLSKSATNTLGQYIYTGTYSETLLNSKGKTVASGNGFNLISKLANPSTKYSVKNSEILKIDSGKFEGTYSCTVNYTFDSYDSAFTTTEDIYYPVSVKNAGKIVVSYDYTVSPSTMTIKKYK